MTRRKLDAYYTPGYQVRALLAYQPGIADRYTMNVLEPCVGDGSISRVIQADPRRNEYSRIITNDIDPAQPADFHYDAASEELYRRAIEQYGEIDWVVTNPPYKMPICTQIVEQALKHAQRGVAMLLRISFREPTAHKNPRGPFLEANPPDRLLTLPRYSYTGNGKSDSATTEWVVWLKDDYLKGKGLPPMLSLYKADETFADALLVRA